MENQYFEDFINGTGGDEFYAAVLYAQAKLESANFTSNIFVNTNNCFGMNQPKVRPTTSLGGWTGANGNLWANYSSVETAVNDRVLWDDYFKVPAPTGADDVSRYMNEVQQRGYAEDPQYIKKWKSIFEQISGLEIVKEAETTGPWKSPLITYAIIGFILYFFLRKRRIRRYARKRLKRGFRYVRIAFRSGRKRFRNFRNRYRNFRKNRK